MKKQFFIRGDLNSLQDGYISLRNPVWISILRNMLGTISNGQKIWLYEHTSRRNTDDLTIFPGIITIDKNANAESCYKIRVNEKDFEYLSESKRFKNYSSLEIIGDLWEKEVKKNFPDLIKYLPSHNKDFN